MHQSAFASSILARKNEDGGEEIDLIIQKLEKRSLATLMKALETLHIRLIHKDRHEFLAERILPRWSGIYQRLWYHEDKSLRFLLNQTFAELVPLWHRSFAPYLKHIMAPWLCAQCEVSHTASAHASPSSEARRAFHLAFSTKKKRVQAMSFCQTAILDDLVQMCRETPQSLFGDATSLNDAKMEQFYIYRASSIRAMASFLDTLFHAQVFPIDLIDDAYFQNEFNTHITFTTMQHSKTNGYEMPHWVRKQWIALMLVLIKQVSSEWSPISILQPTFHVLLNTIQYETELMNQLVAWTCISDFISKIQLVPHILPTMKRARNTIWPVLEATLASTNSNTIFRSTTSALKQAESTQVTNLWDVFVEQLIQQSIVSEPDCARLLNACLSNLDMWPQAIETYFRWTRVILNRFEQSNTISDTTPFFVIMNHHVIQPLFHIALFDTFKPFRGKEEGWQENLKQWAIESLPPCDLSFI